MRHALIRGGLLGAALIGLATTVEAQRLSNPLSSALPGEYARYYGIAPTLGDPAYSTQSFYYYDANSGFRSYTPAFNPYALGPAAPFVAGLGTRSFVAPSYAP